MQSGANFGAPLGLLFVRAVASYTGLIETVAQSLREHRGGIAVERTFYEWNILAEHTFNNVPRIGPAWP